MADNDPHPTEYDPGEPNLSTADTAPTSPGGESLDHPERIGRYRIRMTLGKGGFGLVYLADDEQLNRSVAVKVPHAQLVSHREDAELYLTEARTVANLDHPRIVPVYDIGSTDEYPCYIVSKYVEGNDLASRLKRSRLNYDEAAELVATVAETLHYAHKQGLVHRDVKPANILIGKDGKPHVVDFGLALREENLGKESRYAGTPAYMSPEQASGEGHRVDGRSDVYSLGAVFYELLVGRRTFTADNRAELLKLVANKEVKPLRQIDDRVPKELERICLKALAKRASERYPTARDMAEELRHFLQHQTAARTQSGAWSTTARDSDTSRVGSDLDTDRPSTFASDRPTPKIVPKGLRSFDRHDADFFLELLPGPRDHEGLPDSVRFWKTQIEETDADDTFSVGLIYGPSGCGKSSLVKAGLLPRLSPAVIPVYVEATADETETRLLNGLRKRCPGLPQELDLTRALAALRRGQCIPVAKKLLIVVDQFEQWLHARKEEEDTELVQALRQCDGGRVQCIVMVRDDFWMAVTRFLRALEIRLVEGHNLAAVDLFPELHATKVLAAFGQAFGMLSEETSKTSQDQQDFLERSVAGLAEEGKVICVNLALFAEMMKGKSWTTAALKEVGGTKGVGVTFLEETFSSSTASPEHRYHQKAAREVLNALLPDSGTDIKGHMRTHDELLEASGYARRPDDFDDLIKMLDSDIRLITPTDPDGTESNDNSQSHAGIGQKYYQLTHDYLVPSLRDWLTRKQQDSHRGRAELRLAERSAAWSAKPENRQLPTWWEVPNIWCFTRRSNWTEQQRETMKSATWFYATRSIVLTVFLVVIFFGAYESYARMRARTFLDRLRSSAPSEITSILDEMKPFRRWANPMLQDDPLIKTLDAPTAVTREEDKTNDNSDSPAALIYNGEFRKWLNLKIALCPIDDSQLDEIYEVMLESDAYSFSSIRESIRHHRSQIAPRLWKDYDDPKSSERRRFVIACVLADYDSENKRWKDISVNVSKQLLVSDKKHVHIWADALSSVADSLVPPLLEYAKAAEFPILSTEMIEQIFLARFLAERFYSLESVPELNGRRNAQAPARG